MSSQNKLIIKFESIAKRDLKKNNVKYNKKEILNEINRLISNPFLGEKLSGYTNWYSLHIRIKNQQYRCIYIYEKNKLKITIICIALRKNVYKKLKRRT